MFWIGLGVGLVVGTTLGIFAISLCIMGKDEE